MQEKIIALIESTLNLPSGIININTKIDLRSSELNQTFQKSLQENNDKISEQFLKTNDSINQINTDVKNNNKIIKIIGGISALGVVLGVIICVLLFTKLG